LTPTFIPDLLCPPVVVERDAQIFYRRFHRFKFEFVAKFLAKFIQQRIERIRFVFSEPERKFLCVRDLFRSAKQLNIGDGLFKRRRYIRRERAVTSKFQASISVDQVLYPQIPAFVRLVAFAREQVSDVPTDNYDDCGDSRSDHSVRKSHSN